jgi:hypothetical protein
MLAIDITLKGPAFARVLLFAILAFKEIDIGKYPVRPLQS